MKDKCLQEGGLTLVAGKIRENDENMESQMALSSKRTHFGQIGTRSNSILLDISIMDSKRNSRRNQENFLQVSMVR
jgi:hypothetical protein